MVRLSIQVIAGLVVGGLSCIEASPFMYPPWGNETIYGKYQGPWKLLKQRINTSYFLVKATYYTKSVFWGDNFKCVKARTVEVFDQNKTVLFEYTFKNGTRTPQKAYTTNQTVSVTKRDHYSKTFNALNFTLGGGRMLVEPVIFTDGRTCNLLSVPYMQTRKECELWVKSTRINSIPPCCLFMFDYVCRRPITFNIYDPTLCTERPPR
uniref:Putative lipocal-1 1 n=1 Tax=Amblyomma parvum TaxID=251391 RepID=A0A023FZ57_AMBPA